MIVVSGTSLKVLAELIEQNSSKIISVFKNEELRKTATNKKIFIQHSCYRKALGIKLNVPSVYRIAKNKDNFFLD